MRALPKEIGTLHFVGIGGIGMSGIAEILHALGYDVQGSDIAQGGNVERLQKKGIQVFIGHDSSNIADASVLVISSAIKSDNPELCAAQEKKIPVVRRAEMLAELMRLKWAVAVGGTHGKTTTTTMVGAMLEEGGFDPTVINGGIVNKYGTNTRLGQSDWMVVEADESDGTFTQLPAAVSIVTNIDQEHMDHYGSFDDVRDAFLRFVQKVPFYGFSVLCTDNEEVQTLVSKLSGRPFVTYGFNPQADIRAVNVTSGPGGSTYDVVFSGAVTSDHKEQVIEGVMLPMPGQHNVQNSLAAIAVGQNLGMKAEDMISALKNFSGVKRRFTKTGEVQGITIIDDYGHHPVEIQAVLKAARTAVDSSGNKVIAVVQPHRYSRLHNLFDDFCSCLNAADSVIVADVYPAGEDPIAGVDKENLAEGIKNRGHRDVRVLPGPDSLAGMVSNIANDGDYVVCLGAGNITSWAQALPGQLEEVLKVAGAKT